MHKIACVHRALKNTCDFRVCVFTSARQTFILLLLSLLPPAPCVDFIVLASRFWYVCTCVYTTENASRKRTRAGVDGACAARRISDVGRTKNRATLARAAEL